MKLAWVGGVVVFAAMVAAQKQPMDHSVYDGWKSIRQTTFSNDGKWLAYVVAPQEGDAVLELRSTDGGKNSTIERVSAFRFSGDSKFLVATIVPKFADAKKARIAKAKPEDMPKASLLIMNLATGEKIEKAGVTSFSMAEEDKGWVLYRPEPPKAAAPTPAPTPAPDAKPAPKDDKPKKKAEHRPGDTWILRELATATEQNIDFLASSRFNKKGNVLVYALSTKDGAADGIVYRDLVAKSITTVVPQLGRYTKLTITEDGSRVAYQTDKDDYAAKKPSQSVYVLEAASGKTRLVAKEGSKGLAPGYIIADGGTLTFSKSGRRLTIATQPKPAEEKPDPTPDEDKVSVDVWSWTDPLMMPQQLLQATMEKGRTYDALIDLGAGDRLVQLETPQLQNVSIGNEGDGPVGLGQDNLPYRREISWGLDYTDLYIVDLTTGKADRLMSKFEGNAGFSPGGNYIAGYESPLKDIFTIDVKTRQRVSLSSGINQPIWNEEFDNPDYPPMYGIAGWTPGDGSVLIYDKFDIWQSDPSGKKAPTRITGGRTIHNSYRIIDIDPDDRFVGKEFLAMVTDDMTKASGLHRVSLDGRSDKRLIWGDKRFLFSAKAKNADKWAITRQDFVEYPDVWLTNANLENPVKVSDANPQQKNYWWGKAELVNWRSNDGEELQGILIKPENFDYGKKYPLIAYFYERDSDTLNQYRPPAPSASTISLPMYASNGYVIFIPDIPYKEGYPGESAVSAITSGVNSIIARGYVNPKRCAIQGQSWGGYQVGYLVTETNMFKCACAGAPVSDMVSAYDGIRWGSGLVRQMQYEHGQSRIAGSLWDKPLRYIENSPIFHVDKIKTPLLIMSNDKDGSVPWYQGIEYFSALRRLNKPAWLVVYNGEDHNLVERKNRKDWSVRMQQFFDYYLKDAAMPKWMAEGVPATEKGKTYGFELTKKSGG